MAAVELILLVLASARHPHLVEGILGHADNLVAALVLLPRVIAAGLIASFGITVHWHAVLVVSKSGDLAASLDSLPAALGFLIPAITTVALGRTIGHRTAHGLPARVFVAAGLFGLASAALAVLAQGTVAVDTLLGGSLAVPPVGAAAGAFAWALLGGTVGAASVRVRSSAPMRIRLLPRVLMPVLGSFAVLSEAAAAANALRAAPIVSTGTGSVSAFGLRGPAAHPGARSSTPEVPAQRKQAVADALSQLRSDSQGVVETVNDPIPGTPGFVRLRLPVGAGAGRNISHVAALIARYGGLFGISDVAKQLRLMDRTVDSIGMTRLAFQQVFDGYPVYGATLTAELNKNGTDVVALSNSLVPDVRLPPGDQVSISRENSVALARKALANGVLVDRPQIYVFPG